MAESERTTRRVPGSVQGARPEGAAARSPETISVASGQDGACPSGLSPESPAAGACTSGRSRWSPGAMDSRSAEERTGAASCMTAGSASSRTEECAVSRLRSAPKDSRTAGGSVSAKEQSSSPVARRREKGTNERGAAPPEPPSALPSARPSMASWRPAAFSRSCRRGPHSFSTRARRMGEGTSAREAQSACSSGKSGESASARVAGSSAKRTARRSGSAGRSAPSATRRPSSEPRRQGIAHAGDARTSAGDQSRKGGRAERMSREFMLLRSELKG